MRWLGLDADDGPYFQMDRLDEYRQLAEDLKSAGKAYDCYCSREELASMRDDQKARGLKPRYDGRCRDRIESEAGTEPVVRFKNPTTGTVVVRDRIKGDVEFDNAELDDLVILRSDGVPTYNFSVVVDDSQMRITHVVRGDDHLNNTPRQLNLLEALNLEPPEYAHLPMILGTDGSRLSKRHGAVSVLEYRDAGFLPQALLNYLVRLGWSHGDQELFTVDEMIEHFSLEGVNDSAASFDSDKCLWVNQHWLKHASPELVSDAVKPFLEALSFDIDNGPSLNDLVEVQRERARTLVELAEKSRFVYEEPETYEPKAVKKHFRDGVSTVLEALSDKLGSVEHWDNDSTQNVVEGVAEELELKLGAVAQPLRVAVTGTAASPGIGQTLVLLGREKTLRRLLRANDYVSRGTRA